MDLNRGVRFLQGTWRNAYQDFSTNPSTDVVTRDLQVRFGKRWGEKNLAVELSTQTRLSDQIANNTAWKIGLVYGWRFGNQGRSFDATGMSPVPTQKPVAEKSDELDLTQLLPGMRLADARAYVQGFGLKSSQAAPGIDLYEDRVIPDVNERQRVFLEHKEDRLLRAGVIVDVGSRGSAETVETLLGRLLNRLSQRYGAPTTLVEEGTLGPNLAEDLRNGRLIRNYHWRTAFGVLRMGIPRRLDRQVRIEIQHRPPQGSVRNVDWSVEKLR
jgi:hypothetical protein